MFKWFVKIIQLTLYCDLTSCKSIELSILFVSVLMFMNCQQMKMKTLFKEISLSFVSLVFNETKVNICPVPRYDGILHSA